MKSAAIAILLATVVPAAAAAEGSSSQWKISADQSPFSNLVSVTASIEAEGTVLNQIGNPERPILVVRCNEQKLATYVSWPQVLSHDGETAFLELPQTLALWRIDDGKVKADFWVLSQERTGAGYFDTKGAQKFLSNIEHGHKLAVRMTGRSAQDAAFDLTGIGEVAAKLRGACGLGPPVPLEANASAAAGVVLGANFMSFGPLSVAVTGSPGGTGAFIVGVVPGSVAERGGLQRGDVVGAFDGRKVVSQEDLLAAVRAATKGKRVVATVLRAGVVQTLNFDF